MIAGHYRDIVDIGSNYDIGVALGKAIKDFEVKPDEYALLCKRAKDKGFKFVNIQFVKS